MNIIKDIKAAARVFVLFIIYLILALLAITIGTLFTFCVLIVVLVFGWVPWCTGIYFALCDMFMT